MTAIGPIRLCALAVVAAANLPGTAHAQSVDKFYSGNSLKLVVASGAGGGYDSYARALGQHIGRHLPGTPNVVVQNMPGASGLKATNYIYNVAPKDGGTIALTNAQMTLQPLFTMQGVQYDPFKLNWLGTMGKQYNLCLTWHSSPIKTIADAQAHQTTVSSTSATGAYTAVPNILNALIGTKFKVISGYETAAASLAVERGEVDGLCGISYGTLMTSNANWVTEKKVNFLAQLAMRADPRFPDVPMVLDMVTDPGDRRVLELILVVQEVGRPLIAPPSVPAERLAALRTAFEATMRDPAFVADADRRRLEVEMLDHVAVERMLKDAYASPKDVVERAATLLPLAQ